MKAEKYIMSFTTGGLFHIESVKLAELYVKYLDWRVVQEETISKNLLQARTISTAKRVYQEIIARLKQLSQPELVFLIESNSRDQSYLLWAAVCRRYRFIADFAVEVLRERFLGFKLDLLSEEFNIFFNTKSEWHPELEQIKPATRDKCRQVLFKILREADLLSTNNAIKTPLLSPTLLEVLMQSDRRSIMYFPVFESR